MFLLIFFFLSISSLCNADLLAGVAKIDATMPVGTPLAGYNHGDRRVPYWPVPVITPYTTFMSPSVGVLDATFAKALVLDDGTTSVCLVTVDAIGADGTLMKLAYNMAVDQGFDIPWDNVILSGSHSHSGPGGISPEFLWAMAPATDLMVPSLQRLMAQKISTAMIQARNNKKPAAMNIGVGQLIGVTSNRRCRISPYVNCTSIDPNLGVIRVDSLDGKSIATVWNFAIHGVCYGPSNMKFSADIMGYANTLIEKAVGGVSLFINADAGDIDPGPTMCDSQPTFKGSSLMANAVVSTRASLKTSSDVKISAVSQLTPFGPTNLNLTLSRILNCTHGGPIDLCSFCAIFNCVDNVHLYESWVELNPKFTAMRFDILGLSTVLVTMPGEPLLELGWWVRNDTLALGFNNTILAGYSNSHMGYFCTPDEYDIGGYESELTFWGINTAQMVRDGVRYVAAQLAGFRK